MFGYTHWIFDLDNTLADSAIDFDAIRRALDLPPDKPILEEIGTRPATEASALHKRLEELERAYALRATPLPGAQALLAALAEHGCPRGILTRNSRANAFATLAGCGLAGFFAADHVLGRDEAAPKPDPAGVQKLLAAWDAAPAGAVMVGDFHYDLEAGHRAGIATIYYDPQDQRLWTDHADIRVQSHTELLALINGNAS